ncbi:MAG: hypothetical protein AAGD96_17945 [Chloroflexota bacterium]
MDIIRAKGIPIWITAIAILFGAMGTFLGVNALINPSTAVGFIDGADVLALSWAGRNLGLGIALLVAVFVRSAGGYAVAFGGAMFREIGDIFAQTVGDTGFGFATLAVLAILELVCFGFALRAVLAQRNA